VGLFAALHGHAHGAEMASATGAGNYIAGFTLATALLHVLAVVGVVLLQARHRDTLVRVAGAAVAAAGAMLLAL